MKIRSILIATLLPLAMNADMSITALERVTQEVAPDILRGGISFEEQHKNPSTIKEHFNALIAEMKRNDPKGEFCRGGGFYLSPRYSYKDQKQEFIGYSGNLSFNCEFTSIDQYNTMMSGIEKVKTLSIRTVQEPLSWGVSDKIQTLTRQSLRAKLLQTAKSQADLFSKETDMTCKIAAVAFEGTQPIRPMMMKSSMIADTALTESPIQKNEELSLEANVNYICSKRIP